jgi:hypothetical protein
MLTGGKCSSSTFNVYYAHASRLNAFTESCSAARVTNLYEKGKQLSKGTEVELEWQQLLFYFSAELA